MVVFFIFQASVVQRVDDAIHRINHYPVDSVDYFADTYPLDSYPIVIHALNNWALDLYFTTEWKRSLEKIQALTGLMDP